MFCGGVVAETFEHAANIAKKRALQIAALM
jgi:hypothetical protein